MKLNGKEISATVTFTADGYQSVTCFIDEPGFEVDPDSYGQYDTVIRPQNVALLEWTHYEPMKMSGPILLEGLMDGMRSVEDDIAALERLAGRGPGAGGRKRPPSVTLSAPQGFGALIPHNFNGESLPWAITSLSLPAADAIRRNRQADGSGGHRVRQHGVVEVTQWVQDSRVEELSVSRRKNAHPRRRTTHTVKNGETLQSISRAEYGTADRWQDIALANGIRDPRHLPSGKRLKLPK